MDIIELVKNEFINNQFFSGGIGVSLFASFLYLCREVPTKIYNYIDRNLVWTIRINNSSRFYEHFLHWASNTFEGSTKRIKVENMDENGQMHLGLNYGRHWKFVKGAFVVVNIDQEEAQNSLLRKELEKIYKNI